MDPGFGDQKLGKFYNWKIKSTFYIINENGCIYLEGEGAGVTYLEGGGGWGAGVNIPGWRESRGDISGG
jgi:hypothetical protein